MAGYETKYEYELTDEPETLETREPQGQDTNDWDSLADVPFAGEKNGVRSAMNDFGEFAEDDVIEVGSMEMQQFDDVSGETLEFSEDTGGGEFRQPGAPGDMSHFPEDVQDMSDVKEWLGDINPNYDEFNLDSPYCNNCGSCAYAVYRRLEGDTDITASAENIPYNEEMEALTGMEQVSMSPEEIEKTLLAQGDGAHAIIGIDRAEGPGHWFNAACIDGKVVAIDGQTGEIRDWPPDYGDVVNWEMSVKTK